MVDWKSTLNNAYNKAKQLPTISQASEEINKKLESQKSKFDKSQGVVKNVANLSKNAALDIAQQINSVVPIVVDPIGNSIYNLQKTPQAIQGIKSGYEYYKNNPNRIAPDLGQAVYQYPATTAMLATGVAGGAKGAAGAAKNAAKVNTAEWNTYVNKLVPQKPNIPSLNKTGTKLNMGGDMVKGVSPYAPDILPVSTREPVNIPSINRQGIRQSEINNIARRESDLQQIRDAVNSIDTGEPNINLDLVKMEDLLPGSDNISVYDYFSKYNPEAYSRTEYSPYTTSYLVDQYAKGAGISPEEAVFRIKNNTNTVWSLPEATGAFIPSDDNGYIRLLNPEAYKWTKSNIPRDATYTGITGGEESLLNTVNHELAHKLMVDLNTKLAKGEITPEGADFLMKYNGLTPQGAKSESISHAAGSIPLEGNLKIPEGRIESYNEVQPFSEFSNESFRNQRNMLSNEIRQRAIDNEFGLINKEFESNVDKYLNGIGVNRFGGTTW